MKNIIICTNLYLYINVFKIETNTIEHQKWKWIGSNVLKH